MHRFFHGQRFWCFHAVHHASIDLDWLSSVRVHPVNDAIMRLAAAVPLLLTGCPTSARVGIAPLLTLLAILVHADVDWDWGPLRSVIASPLFHRWHHTSEEEGLDKNFAGLLPAWDIMFGTYYMPKGKVPEMFWNKNLSAGWSYRATRIPVSKFWQRHTNSHLLRAGRFRTGAATDGSASLTLRRWHPNDDRAHRRAR